MAEVCRPVRRLEPGETYTADSDGAVVIEDRNSHSDVLRYVVADVGYDHALGLLVTMTRRAVAHHAV